MTPRERALIRLRWVSSFGPRSGHGWSGAGLLDRLSARLEARLPEPRPVPGASLGLHSGGLRRARPVAVGPYAPLLMRIVRDPFPLRPGGATRQALVIADPRRPRAEPGPRLAEVSDGIREARAHGAPMRRIDHRPVERPRPFARIREPAL
ncbi:MAG TPA: hypothetical protein ENK18_21135 [Deltaproteobacteria bacterium]|nr:hypothetical protein [Deltaproteobacteria bacterium]